MHYLDVKFIGAARPLPHLKRNAHRIRGIAVGGKRNSIADQRRRQSGQRTVMLS